MGRKVIEEDDLIGHGTPSGHDPRYMNIWRSRIMVESQ